MDLSLKIRLALIPIVVAFIASQYFFSAFPEPTPPPQNGFSFAALGDAPYGVFDEMQYKFVLQNLSDNDLKFVLHVGDILGSQCSDSNYQQSLAWFNSIQHPVFYTPGDNEWTDCYGYDPYERLNRIREIFFAEPNRSLGAKQMPTTVQAKYYNRSSSVETKYVENQFWTVGEIGFATVHLVGSHNGMGLEDPAEAEERLQMAMQWTSDVFGIATSHNGAALVIAFHANPGFGDYHEPDYQQAYQPFLDNLAKVAKDFGKPVLIIQGDDHEYRVDHPLKDPNTGQTIKNLTRLQVPGSPKVGWVKVNVITGEDQSVEFDFQEYVVPSWKYF